MINASGYHLEKDNDFIRDLEIRKEWRTFWGYHYHYQQPSMRPKTKEAKAKDKKKE